MYLARLELNGFKSFPHHTQMTFEEGMMGVVGPNGCGKTNILDSIRWVLGEQRPTLLRSSKHDEIIFNGTTELPPTDMAEVSLIVKNTRGLLPVEYDEVVITRRLFRSGESEYLINKKQCRLRDITDLFADTGMGTHAYSVFQTGMIDAVLSENADERRYLFEEAAGITKYKARKKEALKKLENTEADMLRVGDIIAEISKNVRSLHRQAGRARRFKSIRDDLKNLEITQAAARMYDLGLKIKKQQTKILDLKTQKEGLTAAVAKNESETQQYKFEIAALDENISNETSRSASIDGQVIRLENNIENIENALSTGKENAEIWTIEITSLRGRIDLLTSQKIQSQKQLEESSYELADLNKSSLEYESIVLDLKSNIDLSQRSVDSLRQEFHLVENILTADTTRLDGVGNLLSNIANNNSNIDSSVLAFQAKKDTSEQNLGEQQKRIKECEEAATEIDAKLAGNQQIHLQVLAEIDNIKKEISSISSEYSASKARFDLLSQMIAQHEGYGSGIKSTFDWQDRPKGVIDTLANLLISDKRYHLAIESAINNYGQLVVCRTYDDAAVCIEYLKTNKAGRAGFLILDRAASANKPSSVSKRDGLISTVAEIVKCEDYLRLAVNTLFADTVVFEAGKIPTDYNGEAVDLDGRYFSNLGTLEGGHTAATLVGRRGELADIQNLLQELSSKVESLQKQLGQKELDMLSLNDAMAQLADKKKTLSSIRERLLADISRLDFEFKQSASRLDQLSLDCQQSAKRAAELKGQQAELETIIAASKQKLTMMQEQLNAASTSLRALSEKYDGVVSELNQQRLRSVELSGLIRKLEDDIRRFAEIIDEATQMISQKTSMIDAEKLKWQEFEIQEANLKVELKKLFAARDSVDHDKDALFTKKSGLTQQLDIYESELKKLRHELNAVSEQIHSVELLSTELQAQSANTENSIFHETGMKITPAKTDDYDENGVLSEIERYKRIVEKLGPVNMLADDEYQTEKDRLDFLEAQMKDLNDAKSSLREAIGKINATAEEKFTTTFMIIKENFQKVFETLFEGGTAEVKLYNPDDVLESPIEIIARPGSKKVTSLGQLSGGERALTAISLLFSIYMVKPSPFCILDEIDAPLDDANVTRFLKLLDKFTDFTQFIVITHNKKTMEAANILYGVTMEKPGVSSIVSVKFNGFQKAPASV